VGGLSFFWAWNIAQSNSRRRIGEAHRRYNRSVSSRLFILAVVLGASFSWAQKPTDNSLPGKSPTDNGPKGNSPTENGSTDKSKADATAPANRGNDAQESSSRETKIDISAPAGDDKSHPGSKEAVADLDGSENPDSSGVQEFHPWSPLKAMKDVEVGDFYFKRKNYKAALERYKEALYYKEGDALATFRLAVCEEKLGDKSEARKYFEQYLKVLPEGPFAKDARNSLDRMAKK
jgi:tetratricopeptide (TPR) repeat protein